VAALGSRVFNVPGAQRRFTGSYETASFSGDFPTVSWLFDDPTPIDARTWQLRIAGAVEQPLAIDYARLLELATATLTATLDCTGGWYSTQEWRGAPVGQLLNLAQPKATAHTVIFHSSTGHDRRYSLAEARQLLLATHVGGTPLNHDHGFPARLVAPGHRGYDWVKWVIGIEVVESAWFWQLPLPLR
jgi:DMSO/TMAO reductase YedYZ molybdopterin-dependent catalytic subunit